jgi:hypothetical protein
MAFQNMPDLGYKDDGPLGAFFAGIQGGNANTASQLANAAAYEKLQQDQYDNPLESIKKLYEAQLANAKSTSPDYIPAQLRGQIGQTDSQAAAGDLAKGLLPFKMSAQQAELESEGSKNRLFGNMYKGIETQHDQSLDPNVREAGGQRGFFLADTLSRVDPSVMAKERMLEGKLDNNIDIAEMRNQAMRDRQSAIAKVSDPKYKEQQAAHQTTIAQVENKIRMGKQVSQEEYESYLNSHRWMQQHQLNLQVGSGRNFTGAPGLEQFGIQRGPSAVDQTQQAAPLPMPGAQQVPPAVSVKTQVEAAGQTYDPSKYDYRISPTGEVQRKAKG